jgi:hypothetical protein
VVVIGADAVADQLHRFRLHVVGGACGWRRRQALLVRARAQAATAVAVGRQVNRLLQVVVAAVRVVVVGGQRVVVVACKN